MHDCDTTIINNIDYLMMQVHLSVSVAEIDMIGC